MYSFTQNAYGKSQQPNLNFDSFDYNHQLQFDSREEPLGPGAFIHPRLTGDNFHEDLNDDLFLNRFFGGIGSNSQSMSNIFDSDQDEDYSLQEDLIKNFKKYKHDEKQYNITIPKSELHKLLEDAKKMNEDTHSRVAAAKEMIKKKRQHPENQKFSQHQQQGAAYKRWKQESQVATVVQDKGMVSVPYSQANNNIDAILIKDQDSQHFGQQILRPNLQNNFYYNFNNNYGADGVGSSQQPPQAIPSKQVKSIEVQVTPEKLQEPEEEDQSKVKKRRKRKINVKQPAFPDNNSKNGYWNHEGPQMQGGYPQYPYYNYGQNPYYMNPNYRYQPYYPTPVAPYYMPGQVPPNPYMNPHQIPGYPNPGMKMNNYQQQMGQFDENKSKEHMRDYLRTMFYPFSNEQLKELVQQIEIYIQMLYQMLLLSKSTSSSLVQPPQQDINSNDKALAQDQIKYRAYCLLYDFQSKKEQTLKPLNLPNYKIPMVQTSNNEPLQMNPQVSFYQSPQLELAPEIIKQLSKPNQDVKQQIKFLNQFQPLINQYLLPIQKTQPHALLPYIEDLLNNSQKSSQDGQDVPIGGQNSTNNNRRKFSHVDDNFLLLGLRQYGYKEVELIRSNWLPNKTSNEIKHRYKNLTCAKAPDNIIKRWKLTHSIPLSEGEEKQLARAIKWFGANTNRWSLISKCYLPNRSPQFLKLEYQSIVQDNERAEKFGRLMLSDDEEEKAFEDIDLDKFSGDDDDEDEDDDSKSQIHSLSDFLANFGGKGSDSADNQEELNDDEDDENGEYEEVEL